MLFFRHIFKSEQSGQRPKERNKAGKHHAHAVHQHVQRLGLGAALGVVVGLDGPLLGGVGGQAVHRLGGEGHQLALPQKGGGLFNLTTCQALRAHGFSPAF